MSELDDGIKALDNELNADEQPTAQQQAAPEKKAPTRLYFLRLPKPDTADKQLEVQGLEAELAQYKEACDRALAIAKLANETRHQRRDEYTDSHKQFQATKQDREALLERLRPLREVNKQVNNNKNELRDRKSGLPATSIAELDAKIQALEYKQAHESMDRKAENQLIADIKKINKSRPDVARYEAEHQRVRCSLCLCVPAVLGPGAQHAAKSFADTRALRTLFVRALSCAQLCKLLLRLWHVLDALERAACAL